MFARRAAQLGWLQIRRSSLVTRLLFGLRVPPLEANDYCFDVTTRFLIDCAKLYLNRDSHVLDLGTGACAVVGLTLWREVECRVTSSDVNPALVASARRAIARNDAPISVFQSNFFEGLQPGFDTVVFNPPYVPSSIGARRGLTERASQWDGGTTGTSVIDAFLEAVCNYDRPLRVLMGVNRRHCPARVIAPVLERKPELHREAVLRHSLLPVDVYVFRSSPTDTV